MDKIYHTSQVKNSRGQVRRAGGPGNEALAAINESFR